MGVLTPNELKNLLKYKYRGVDHSFISKNILSPFAQSLVDNFTPRWIAPNLITLIGLLFSVASFFLTIIFNPTLDINAPRWLHLFTGIGLFAYQTLDAMDGKQARLTGTSSPLGMIFDHGCDAINSVIMIIPMASVLGLGQTYRILPLMTMSFTLFYIQCWEEYYREEMVFAFINGPTEGLLSVIGMCILSYINGAEYWHIPQDTPPSLLHIFPSTYKRVDLYSSIILVMVAVTAIAQIISGYGAARSRSLSLFRASVNLIPFAVFFSSTIAWLLYSSVAIQKYTVFSVLLSGSVLVEAVSHIMLMHICHSTIRPGERHMMWIPLLLAINVLCSSGGGLVDENLIIPAVSLVCVGYTAHRIISVFRESADALDIFIFRQGKRSAGGVNTNPTKAA